LNNPESNSEKVVSIERATQDSRKRLNDSVAVEDTLEIRVVFGPEGKRRSKSLSITMRTPGNDYELADGFLLSENVISHPNQILSFEHVGPVAEGMSLGNTLMVELGFDVEVEIEKLQRHFYTTSSCGVCGKASLDAIRNQGMVAIDDLVKVELNTILNLPTSIRDRQDVFDRTGGLHAAGLVKPDGELVSIREDVGRHNAVDKLVGSQILAAKQTQALFPLASQVLIVSGRASFELMQKALMARIPILVAVGAPSSLAVELANEFDMTLVGFTSQKRCNIYAGGSRVI